MRGHRQGMMISGQHDLGDFGYYGEEMALYDYSGIGVDLDGIGDYAGQAKDFYDGLPGWVKGTVTVAGILALVGLGMGTVKAKSLNPFAKKARTNTRRRRRGVDNGEAT
jgi:hypothetical protein